jgi:hypothetical protein
MPDSPGGLASVLDQMSEENLNIEYLYAFLGMSGNEALVVFKVEDIKQAKISFNSKGIKFIDEQELYQL